MLWFVFALIVAVSVSVRDVLFRANAAHLNVAELAGLELFWGLPLLIVGCFVIPVPSLDNVFWLTLLVSIPLNAIAYFLYVYALTVSPVSLTVPFLAFTPVFMIVTGNVILDESVSVVGCFGILFIVIGSYVLNIDRIKDGIFHPFLGLLHEKGSRIMLLVAFIFSLAAVIGKKGMQHSSPLFFSFFFFTIFSLCMLILLFFIGRLDMHRLMVRKRLGMIFGALLTIHAGFHALAIMLTTAAYMIAVKRSSILFAVLLSWIFLKEQKIIIRGGGVLLMFFGMLLICFQQFNWLAVFHLNK